VVGSRTRQPLFCFYALRVVTIDFWEFFAGPVETFEDVTGGSLHRVFLEDREEWNRTRKKIA
jgi:hypothetical protein